MEILIERIPSNDTDELQHHGIKGMKWGVRRYQRLDGSLTPAGRARLNKISEKADHIDDSVWNNRILAERRKVGITPTDSPDTDILKRGSKLYRMANSGETVDTKRKYMSITDDDRYAYQSMWEMLGMDWDKPMSEYTYTTKGEMRIATGKSVTEHIFERYGKKSYKKLADDLEVARELALHKVDKNGKVTLAIDEADARWLEKFKDDSKHRINKTINKAMRYHLDDILEEFQKRGYDAIVDVEDSKSVADYPVIVLNPSNSIGLKKEDKFRD